MHKQGHTLGKMERLKSRKRIEHLFAEGKSFNLYPLRVNWMMHDASSPKDFPAKFGAGVSSRHFKKAVNRNRIKRLLREAWRLQNADLKEKLSSKNKLLELFVIYTGKELPDYTMIASAISASIKRIQSAWNENNAPHS